MEKEREAKGLVAKFAQDRTAYTDKDYKEARLRVDFLDPCLEALGWDLKNANGLAQADREVTTEDSLRSGRSTKAPDYAMPLNKKHIFFIEAKKPSVNIEEDAAPAYQIRRYSYTAKLALGLLSDFEEWAVYDTRTRPDERETSKHGRVFFCRFDELFAPCENYAFKRNIDYLL